MAKVHLTLRNRGLVFNAATYQPVSFHPAVVGQTRMMDVPAHMTIHTPNGLVHIVLEGDEKDKCFNWLLGSTNKQAQSGGK